MSLINIKDPFICLVIGFVLGLIIINIKIFFNKHKLLTRPQLREVINKVLQKYKNYKIILFLINLDGFHNTIEAFGYDIGNSIIEGIKNKLALHAKNNNILFYYVGFDEYILLYKETTIDETKIINEATTLLEMIAKPFVYANYNIHVTASIGIGVFPDYANNGDRLLRCAELALVDVKNTSKNTYRFYHQDLIDQAIDRTVMNTELLTALNNNELQLYLQPQVDAKTKVLVGAEMLIRWKHLTKGAISPEVFISIAEQTGLIWEIGAWIIKHGCIQAKFLSQELEIEDFKVAINLSSGQFLQGDVIKFIASSIFDTGINPKNIEIELTESMLMANPEKSLLMLSVLTNMGVKIALDDFGVGYSSFSRLRQLQWNYLKIDKSFIKNIDSDPKNYAIVSAIIAMAKSLNIKVIAEGVETEQELVILKKIDCDIIQGYYISKALPLAEFIEFAKQHKNPI